MTKNRFLSAAFLLIAVSTLSLAGCTNNVQPSQTGTISGTVLYTYNGSYLKDSVRYVPKPGPPGSGTDTLIYWPNTEDTATGKVSSQFPGFMQIALSKASSSGVVSAGPVDAIPNLHSVVHIGITFTSLDSGRYRYKFSNVPNGTYVVLPTYDNHIKFAILGGQSAQTLIGVGQEIGTFTYTNPITVNGNDIVYPQLEASIEAALKSRDEGRTLQTESGVISGTVTATNAANWPTGSSSSGQYLALIGFKTTGGGPAPFITLSKPTAGNSSITYSKGLSYATYTNVRIGIYQGSTVVKDSLAVYPGNFTVDGSNKTITWSPTLTLP